LPNVLIGSSSSGATQNAASIKASGDTLFVVIQRWNPYPTLTDTGKAEKGIVVRINAKTKAVIGTTTLTYKNPQTSVLSGGKLYIGSAWDLSGPPYGFGIIDSVSGIEWVKSSDTTSKGILINASVLGGGSTTMVLGGNNNLWTLVYKSWGNVSVKPVPLSNSTITNPITDSVPTVSEASCLVYDSVTTKLFIGNGNPYSTDTTSLKFYDTSTEAYGDVGNSKPPIFPPYSLAIVRW